MKVNSPWTMNIREKILMLTIFCIVGLTGNFCLGQILTVAGNYCPWVWIQHTALFSITSNRFLPAEPTNWIHCRIENRSTNEIVFDSSVNFSLLTLYSGVDITPLHKQTKQLEKKYLNAGESYEWDEVVFVGSKHIQTGQRYALRVSAPEIDGITNRDAFIDILALEVIK